MEIVQMHSILIWHNAVSTLLLWLFVLAMLVNAQGNFAGRNIRALGTVQLITARGATTAVPVLQAEVEDNVGR